MLFEPYSFPKSLVLGLAENPGLARLKLSDRERIVANAFQSLHGVPYQLGHPANLTIPAFVDGYTKERGNIILPHGGKRGRSRLLIVKKNSGL